MIELRWIERTVPAPEFGENMSRRVTVLQYRRRDRYLDVAFINDEDHWSDWQDVPTVSEATP